jgi:integrase
MLTSAIICNNIQSLQMKRCGGIFSGIFQGWQPRGVFMGTKREAKQVAKLTNELVKVTPLAASTSYNIYDTEQRGFCLRVTPTGKAYGIRVKIGGKEYQRSLGRAESTTATAARGKAKTLIGDLINGIDKKKADREKKKAEKELPPAKDLTLEQALESYLSVAVNLKRDNKPLKERTKTDYRYLMKHELNEWSQIPLKDITREKADAIRFKVVEERGATRGVHAMRLIRVLCRKYQIGLQNWEKFFPRSNPRKTGLRPHDGKILFGALSGMTHNLSSTPYVMALLLTGCRRGELANVLVSDVGSDGRTITLRETKNGSDHVIQCSTQLREIVKRLLLDKNGEKRIPDAKLFEHCGDPRKTLIRCNKILQEAADEASEANGTAIVDKSFSLHDLRKLCAITLNSLGCTHSVVMAILNHTPDAGDVTSRHYLGEIDAEEKRVAWQKLADYYSSLAANVIQLPTARAA